MRYMQLARCRGTRIVCGPLESEFLLIESIREGIINLSMDDEEEVCFEQKTDLPRSHRPSQNMHFPSH